MIKRKPNSFDVLQEDAPLLFLPESVYNFPFIPFRLNSDADYSAYKRKCETHLRGLYDLNPDISLPYTVALGLLRANISKRVEHAEELPDSVPFESVTAYIESPYCGLDVRTACEANAPLDPYFERFLLLQLDSIEVGFHFAGADTSVAAFDCQQIQSNQQKARDIIADEYPTGIFERQNELKVTRIIGRAGYKLAVVKTKLEGARLRSADGETELHSRGRRMGVVNLGGVDDVSARLAFRVLAGAGADESLSDEDRNRWKNIVEEYLLSNSVAYQAVFERYYFTREEPTR